MIKRVVFVLIVAVVLGGFDLANRGLMWQFFWSQTGEEAPLAQMRGMVEWMGNLTRPQPINDPLVPIDHNNVNPYGMNTFLHQEVEAKKIDEQLRLIAEAGFGWIREEFTWEEIEVDGRGQFTDSRNDVNGDGVRDTISGWAKFDRIVEFAAKYGISIQARLSNPPQWAQEAGVGDFTPPIDTQDFVNYAVAVAEHYRGQLYYYQIWNEPNIFPEWGWNPDGSPRAVDPAAYTDLLCRTYTALKAVDPEIVVISGALAPTSALWDRDLNDFVFLQRMYDAGAGECFDILSMQGYGLNSGPTDRRMRPVTVNFGRNQYIRDIMVANGDSHKPIWISEAAWNAVPPVEVAPEVGDRYYGEVTPEQAAQYMPLAYQRAQSEWAWVGVMNYWFFTLTDDRRKNEAFYYFRMTEPDYSDEKPTYTTLPVYEAMKTYITTQTPTLYQGVHQLDGHWAVSFADDTEIVSREDAQFGDAIHASSIEFVMYGTDLQLRWQGGAVKISVDDSPEQDFHGGDGWREVKVFSTMLPGEHTIRLITDQSVLLDSVTVIDGGTRNIYPLAVGVIIFSGILLGAVFLKLIRKS